MPILGIVIGEKFERLLAAAQGGTGEADGAFSVLWRDANPALLRYLRVIAPEAAEDIAADTWVQVDPGPGHASAAAKPPGGPGCSRPPAAARSTRAAAGPAVRSSPCPSCRTDAGPGSADPADLVLEKLSTEGAIAVVSTLPRFQAEVILLRVVAGLDTQAVARLVGRSPGAVRVAAHRGLRRLAGTLR